jgi:hypothetical protein
VQRCGRRPRGIETAAIAADQPFDPFLEYAFTQCVQALKPLWREANARGELTFGGVSARQTAFARADQSADTVAKAAGRLRRIAEVAPDADTQRSLLAVVAESGGPKELGVLLSPRAFPFGERYDAALQRADVAQPVRRGTPPAGASGRRSGSNTK